MEVLRLPLPFPEHDFPAVMGNNKPLLDVVVEVATRPDFGVVLVATLFVSSSSE
jgi:hypothetical protein